MKQISEILIQESLSRDDVVCLLNAKDEDHRLLLASGAAKKTEIIGNKIYLRGLIEFSNACSKDCLYCGIRKSNTKVIRYEANDTEILEACRFAWENRYGSVVLQSGEASSQQFVMRTDRLLKKIKKLSSGGLGITLSCGEQARETYRRWFESGAHRYLLRIESSNEELYKKIHPSDGFHNFDARLASLHYLKECGYQTGSGVMIGLPFQTTEHLVDDLLFLKDIDIDMAGMGPYVEHRDTPLFRHRDMLPSKPERFRLSLNMIAVLRLLMPDINIAASTALEAIDSMGRKKALTAGANVVMPNITPLHYLRKYMLYEGKPCPGEELIILNDSLAAMIRHTGNEPGYNEWGDSKHFLNKN